MKDIEECATVINKTKRSDAYSIPFFLLFSSKLESEFLEYYYNEIKNHINFSIYLGLGMFLLFGILDFIVLEGNATKFWMLRALIVLPAILVTLKWSKHLSFKKVYQEIQAGLVFFAGFSILLMIAFGSQLVQEVYYAGLIIVVLFMLIILQIRFLLSGVLSLILFVAYEYIAVKINHIDHQLLINNSFFLFSSILSGMFACYHNERLMRKDFLRNRNLEAEKSAISKANETLELKSVEKNKKLRKISEELEHKINLQKEMMLKLKVTEQKYATLINNMAEGIVVIDKNGEITLSNPAAERIFGVEPGKLLFRDLRTFINDSDMEDLIMKIRSNGGVHSHYEVKITRPNGEVRYLLVSSTPHLNNQNMIMGTLGIFRDITERKKAEREMEIFKNIIEYSNYGSAILDESGTIVYLNRYFAELHGYSQEDLLYNSYSNLVNQSESAEKYYELSDKTDLDAQKDYLACSNNEPLEILNKHKNGEVIPLLTNSIKLKNSSDDSNLTAIVAMDLSVQKENEDIIKKSLEEKEILLMEIHHRVKNNMQIISSMLNLQMKYVDDKVSREQFKICQTRIKSLSLIHEKLYRTKDFRQINFGDYVSSLVGILHQTYRGSCGYVHFDFNIENIFLDINMAIPCALIINEVVTNSLKYAFPDRQTGNIMISLTRKEGEYYLKISDNGIGIDDDFDYVNPSTLGLLLVNSLTAQLHGKLELDKKPGTTIKIRFGEVDLKSYNRLGSSKNL